MFVEYVDSKYFGRSIGGRSIEKRRGLTRLCEVLDEVLDKGVPKLVVFSSPTGYGKSALVPLLADYVRTTIALGLSKVTHVLPMRSMVEHLAHRAERMGRELGLGISIGAQCSLPLGHLKDPMFERDYVVTTLDSYALNMFKVTVFVRSMHAYYEVARAHIYTSFTVFDEAHLFIEEGRPFAAFSTCIERLVSMQLPVLIITATIPSHMIRSLLETLRSIGLGRVYEESKILVVGLPDEKGTYPKELRDRIELVEDRDWIDRTLNVSYETSIQTVNRGNRSEIIENLVKHSNGTTLIVENSPRNCIDVARSVAKLGRDMVVLHGRMRMIDRVAASRILYDAMDRHRDIVVVATQVVEAGIDIDARTLITDAAPMPQLVQRCGRVCRYLEEGSRCKVYVLFNTDSVNTESNRYGPYDLGEVDWSLKLLRFVKDHGYEIGWRTPSYSQVTDNGRKMTTYLRLLELWAEKIGLGNKLSLNDDDRRFVEVLRYVDEMVTLRGRDVYENVLKKIGSFVKDYPMVSLIACRGIDKVEDVGPGLAEALEDCMVYELDRYGIDIDSFAYAITFFSIPVDLGYLRRLLSDRNSVARITMDKNNSRIVFVSIDEYGYLGTVSIDLSTVSNAVEHAVSEQGDVSAWYELLDRYSREGILVGILVPWSSIEPPLSEAGFEVPLGLV